MTRHPIALAVVALLLAPLGAAAELPKDVQHGLETAKYVYIASTRKDGSLGAPAEIWFMWHDGAVYVGTRPTSWRVRRIKAGRPQARIAVGAADGPAFTATGSLVQDAKIEALMLETFAKKYPDRWADHAENFRNGFKDGSRVIVKYVPKS
ncbi:MAG: hypothetical protein SF182_11905 [Deltaproteobacteria bacterium]|nr:hypothetical protein [Deltaproteobacteria bacterium]